MTEYRKKPVVVEAVRASEVIQAAERDWKALPKWIVDAYEGRNEHCKALVFTYEGVHISTLEGVMFAGRDDWIIRGVKGELYPVKNEIFEATYEVALTEDDHG